MASPAHSSQLVRGSGFTIVELIIVIVVVAVLAAIVIVAYNGIQNRANETSVTADLRNISKQVELHKINLGHYPSTTEIDTLKIKVNKAAYGVNPTGATGFYCVNSDGSKFSIVTRVKSQMVLMYTSDNGQTTTYSGSQTAPQLCTDSGVPTTTYLAFTNNGVWNSWIDN
jgi:prepilin-type N-terminal cleavage/methylation domain-containing protein